MPRQSAIHLDDAVLGSLLAGQLPPDQVREAERHLASCPPCGERLTALARQRLGDDADHLQTRDQTRRQELIEPAALGPVVGRYRLLELIGSGAMGQVHAAYDPDLDRKVAIKLLHPRAKGSDASQRMLREAQALAKISHPGVVAVHDVGLHEDRVFLAMELSTGGTLRSWMSEAPRTFADALPLLAQVARGLGAAHAAGLVHRDVKPDNILVDRNGRARIGDFGLASYDERAQPLAGKGSSVEAWSDSPAESPAFLTSLTATGAVVGTPAYMAPEQLAGQPASAKSDQFSFCVTAFEALYGARPFPATSFGTLVEQICSGRIVEPPSRRKVPSRVHAALLRGLSVDPSARHPSMRELAALFDGVSDKRRIYVVAGLGGAAAAVAAAVAVASSRGGAPDPCAGAESELAGIWDAERKAQTERAFTEAHATQAPDQLRRILPALDTYRAQWLSATGRACKDTRVRKAIDEQTLALRTACLREKRRNLAALTARLVTADASTVMRAVDLVAGLSLLDRCEDDATLRANAVATAAAPPSAAQERLDDELSALALAVELDRELSPLLPRIGSALTTARALGYRRGEGRALGLRGHLEYRSGELAAAETTLREAALVADEARDDEIRAEALGHLVLTARDLRNDPAELGPLVQQAKAAYRRTSTGPEAKDWEDVLRMGIHLAEGEFQQAATVARELLTRAERAGTHDRNLSTALEGLIMATEDVTPPKQTLALVERAISIGVRRYGELHPHTQDLRLFEASLRSSLGDHRTSVALLEQAVRAFEHSYGVDSDSVGYALVRLGAVYTKLGQLDQADAVLARALRLRHASYGADHVAAADVVQRQGIVRSRAGELDSAIALQREALRIIGAGLGPDAPMAALSHAELGAALLARKKTRDALVELTRAVAITEKSFGEASPQLPEILLRLGAAHAAARRHDQARVALERALALAEELELDPAVRAEVHDALSRVLTATKRPALASSHRARAEELAQLAATGRAVAPSR